MTLFMAFAQVMFAAIFTGLFITLSISKKLFSPGFFRYSAALIILCWVDAAGNLAQELRVGPSWVQQHLHNVGVAATTWACDIFAFAALFILKPLKRRLPPAPKLTEIVVETTPKIYAIATAYFFVIEIAEVTVFRGVTIAQGYSGQLDWGDTAAYVIGLGICLGNQYLVGRPLLKNLS